MLEPFSGIQGSLQRWWRRLKLEIVKVLTILAHNLQLCHQEVPAKSIPSSSEVCFLSLLALSLEPAPQLHSPPVSDSAIFPNIL